MRQQWSLAERVSRPDEPKQIASPEWIPTVSVLMPAYNVRPFIREAIESVRRQSFRDWELVIVDDGSTDGTFDEARTVAAEARRITCLRSPANEGLGRARARALACARGRFVALMDSDDVAEETWLATRLHQFEGRPELVGVSGSRRLIDESGRVLGRTRERLSNDAIAWQLLFGNPFCQPSAVLKRDAVIRAGGYGHERFLEDWALFARLSRQGPLAQTDDLLVRYRVRTASASRTVGRDRSALETTVGQILCENLSALLPAAALARCPVWPLFRGREPVALAPGEAQRSVAIVLEVFRTFVRGREVSDRPGVAAGALKDLANVLRGGAWSPSLALSSMQGILRVLGASVLLRPRVGREVLVLLALPLTPAWRRFRRKRTS
jgi:hypothetical protein